LQGRRRASSSGVYWWHSFHFEDHERAIVGKRRTLGEPVDFAKHKVSDFSGSEFVVLFDKLPQARGTKELPFAVSRFGDAIRMKDEDISGFECHAPLVVVHFLKDAEGETGQFDSVAPAALVQKRLRLPGVGHAEFLTALLPRGEAGGHEAAFDPAFTYQLVHLTKHFRGLKFLRCQAAHDADSDRAVEGGGRAFAAHIAERYAELLWAITQEVVEVAADLARGDITRGNIETIVFRGRGTQQCALNAFGGLQIALQAASPFATCS